MGHAMVPVECSIVTPSGAIVGGSMDDMTDTLSLPPPRVSRSLSPSPQRGGSPTHLVRCASDRARSPRRNSIPINPIREGRSGSICGGVSKNMLSLCPQLTPSQVYSIRKSWRHINTKGLNNVMRRCFQRTESSCPVVSRAFSLSHTLSVNAGGVKNLGDHATFLLQLVDRIIENDQNIPSELRTIGANHVPLNAECGFGIIEIERFGEVMVDVFVKLDGIRQSKECSRAWRLLISSLVDHLRDGFDCEYRQHRRKSSFNAHTRYFENMDMERRNSTPTRKSSDNLGKLSLAASCPQSRKVSYIN